MPTEVYFQEYGRRDSNSHGVQGPVRVTKDLLPAASKAAVYANFTTPALFQFALPKNTLSVFFCANLCQHLRRGFHAAAFGAPGRGAPIPSAFSLHNRPNDFLGPRNAAIIQGVLTPLLRASDEDKVRLVDAHSPVNTV